MQIKDRENEDRKVLSVTRNPEGDAMDASLPTGKELRLLSAKGMNSRLSAREASSNRGGSSDGYGILVPKRDKQQFSQTP
jgi:hypothetical protein